MSDAILERLRQHESDTRTRFYTHEQAAAADRQITRDLVEAVHKRLDNWEREMLTEIRKLASDTIKRESNGHGG